jgi:formate hydrogenlyase transcriptional activator
LSETADQSGVVLANLPAGQAERRIAFVVALVLLGMGALLLRFGRVQLPQIDAWVPITNTFIFIADLITWFLLISQFNIVRSRALLVLASGYLLTAVLNIPHLLTFPGVFSRTGLFGATIDTSAWLGVFALLGYPLAVLFYATLKTESETLVSQGSTRIAVAASIAIVIAIAVALTWIAAAGESYLPKIIPVQNSSTVRFLYLGPLLKLPTAVAVLLLAVVVLLLLWFRGRSVLHLWLMVVICGWSADATVLWTFAYGRYSLQWYGGRFLYLISMTVVLVVLLKETMTLYGRLAVSLVALRRLSAEKLQRSEAYLSEAQQLSHTGSFGRSLPSGEIYWSEETYNILEYDRAVTPTLELILERVHPNEREFALRNFDRLATGEANLDVEQRLLMPDGRVKHLHILTRTLRTSSGSPEIIGAVTDVTAAKQAEEKLRRSEESLLEAQRLSHMGSWRRDVASGTIAVSPEMYRIFGMSPAEHTLNAGIWFDRVHPEDRERAVEIVKKSQIDKTDYQSDFRIVLSDGTVKHLHAVGHPVLNKAGDVTEFVGSTMDVTARKEAEDRIRQSEREVRQRLDLSPQHIAEFGPDGSRLYVNQVALDYGGITFEQWKSADFNATFHPQDGERLTREIPGNFLNETPFEMEGRLRRRDGQYRWFFLRFNPILDEQGRITRWYAAGTDIEDRKQAEQRLQHENVALREEIDKASMFEQIVGTSQPLQTVLSRISKVAPTDSSVLITGETGTGKELVARAIHRNSQRSARAFVNVNCAAVPRDLIASELFGHEKGAFTGATQRRLGRFELAEGGTIFLDEVGELPAETQIALLRVLQEHEFVRVGGTGSIRNDVRVIAATNRDLEAAIAAGAFRSDLFYRLNVFPIKIPSLRERRDDIPLLVEYFIDRFARQAGKSFQAVNKRSLDLLQSYPWPGNIRELQNLIERSVIVCETETFSVDESWLSRQPPATEPNAGPVFFKTDPSQEKAVIEAALKESGGRVYGPTGAAAKLGIPRSTLESKIRSLKINKKHFKAAGFLLDTTR